MSYNAKKRLYPVVRHNRFYNHEDEQKPGFLLPSLMMMLKSHFQRKQIKLDLTGWTTHHTPVQRSQELLITWIGHATFLIQIGGINILTDPVFGNLSPLFSRITPPGLGLHELPPIDFVLLSHNHRDHMDARSLQGIKKHIHTGYLVPQGDKRWFRERKFERVIENMWWDKQIFVSPYDGVTRIEFMFLPAVHWSQRGLFDYNKSLWGSWMISCNGIKIYFAGDTAYGNHFKNIAYEFAPIDIALMPIGPCEPRNWLKLSHINAEEAGQAFLDLGAKCFIPMHWGTYYFGLDSFAQPLERLNAWWQTHAGADYTLKTLKIGERYAPPIQVTQSIKMPGLHRPFAPLL